MAATKPVDFGSDGARLTAAVDATAFLAVPIATKERPWGLLLVFFLRRPLFVADDLDLLALLTEQTAIALDHGALLSEQRTLVEQLRQRTIELARKEMYIERMLDPLWVLDQENRGIDINPAFTRLFGYSREEVIGRSVFDFLDKENCGILTREFEQREKGLSSTYELTVRAKDGTNIPVLLSGSPIIEGGRVVGKIGVLKDYRELKAIRQHLDERAAQLEAANKELEAFSYSISHDLRAPLRGVDGFSRLLLEDFAPQLPPEAQRYLKLVSDNAQQMGQLIDDLLTFSRLSRQPLKLQSVAPAEIAHQALEDLRAEQEGRRVEIVLRELPACQADPALLRQVFANLLANALKFTRLREEAKIEIGHQQVNGKCLYFVKDNGVGFDMQYAKNLFGVFQRLHRAEEYEGTGVGLAIVQRIIHRHGGRVWAEAEVDKGATFYFTMGGDTPHG